MKILLTISTIIYIIFIINLLYVSKNKREKYVKVKTFTSFLFVMTSIVSFLLGSRDSLFHFMIIFLGLVFCMMGDISLGYCDHKVFTNLKYFKMGVLFFSIAHLFFWSLFYSIIGFYWYDFILPIVLVLMTMIFEKLNLVRLNKLMRVVNIYAAIIGFMATKALQVVLFANITSKYAIFLALGASLFLLSDLLLFFVYFGTKKIKILRYANLSTYYMGCYLLALTSYYL